MQVKDIAVYSLMIALASAQATSTSSGFFDTSDFPAPSAANAGSTGSATGVNIVISHATTQVGGDVTGNDGAANTNGVASTATSKAFAAPSSGVNAGGAAVALGIALGLVI